MLRELQQATLARSDGLQSSSASAAESNGDNRQTAREAAGWAVAHNPALVPLRADVGIAEAELVRAGWLPDPVVSWDAMNVRAVDWMGGTTTTVDYVSGLGSFGEIPRPGETNARIGTALARKEEVQQGILAAEWRLVRAVNEASPNFEAGKVEAGKEPAFELAFPSGKSMPATLRGWIGIQSARGSMNGSSTSQESLACTGTSRPRARCPLAANCGSRSKCRLGPPRLRLPSVPEHLGA